jgi:hypothetical protein
VKLCKQSSAYLCCVAQLTYNETLESSYALSSNKGLLFVKQFLGHKSIENTELYIWLDKQLFPNVSEDNFIIRVVSTVEEAIKLGKVGFEPFMVIQSV